MELAKVGTWTPASLATITVTDLVFQRLGLAGHFCGSCHSLYLRDHLTQFVVLNGMPSSCRSFRASSSVFAVVTTDTFMPRALSTFM